MKKSILSEKEVRHIASLAKLHLTDDEVKKFQEQLSQTLTYVQKLELVNTDHVDIPAQLINLENKTREDITNKPLSQNEALMNSKRKNNGCFQTDAIFEA